MAKRSNKQKLIGWAAFAGIVVLIVGIFLVTRLFSGGAPAPANVVTTSSSAVAEASVSMASSAAPSAEAVASASSSEAPTQIAEAVAPAATPSAAASSAPGLELDTLDQEGRKNLLLTLISQGIFTGVQALDTPPKVGVTALFRGLDPSLQQQFIAVVYAYVNGGGNNAHDLQLIDATTGQPTGSYNAADGLQLTG